MEVIGQAILRHISGHGRTDHAVLESDSTYCNRREHGGKRTAHTTAPGKPFFHLLDIAGIAQPEAGMTHSLAACEQAVGELFGLLMDITLNLLEPFHAIPRRALQFQRFDFPFFLIALQSALNVALMV